MVLETNVGNSHIAEISSNEISRRQKRFLALKVIGAAAAQQQHHADGCI